jgi:hypothetical protein
VARRTSHLSRPACCPLARSLSLLVLSWRVSAPSPVSQANHAHRPT